MALSAAEVKRQRVAEQLKYDTPFWAGGVTKDHLGAWHLPGPKGFQGCAKIVSKDATLVPLIANPWQLELDALLEGQRAEGKPMRAIILKARKLGMSTWVAAKFLQRLTQLEYQHGVVVAQDTKTAGLILNMAKIMWANLPTVEQLGLGFNIRPDVIAEGNSLGRKYLQFGEHRRLAKLGRTGDSIFEIDTANSPESLRGATPTMAHLSEVARWEGEQTARKMLAILNAVAYRPETIVVLESTANGLNHFYKRWQSATSGENDPQTGETYKALFIPWWRDGQYTQPFASQGAREDFIASVGDTSQEGEVAEDEPMLQEAYGLTAEQLFWRRMMIRTQHDSNVELFNQEFPHNPESAFIGSGRTVYAQVLINRAMKAAVEAPEPVVGTLRAEEWREHTSRSETVRVPSKVIWVPGEEMRSGEPRLELWEHPKHLTDDWPEDATPEEGAYIVFVDSGEGEGNTFTAGDYHVAQVWDHRTHMQVAVHESRMDINLLPEWVLLIGLYYNTAWVAPEINGPGIVLVNDLRNKWRYKRLYRRKRFGAVKEDEDRRPGWKTDAQSKPVMEAALGEALQDGTHGFRDVRTARQLATYVITEKGKRQAQDGEHDDRLIAAMGCHQIMRELRPPRAGRAREVWRPTDDVTGW